MGVGGRLREGVGVGSGKRDIVCVCCHASNVLIGFGVKQSVKER